MKQMEKPKLCLITIGCKANQYDSAALLGYLKDQFTLTAPGEDTPADIYIINTCAVTHRADFDDRQWIRRARKWNPKARIIVTGCLSANPAGLKDVPVSGIFNPGSRGQLVRSLGGSLPKTNNDIFYHPAGGEQFRSRGLVKVQEGCNYRCSYCIVPYARGKSRSLEPAIALEQIRGLCEQGFREISLCGINLGEWGKDSGMELADLLEKIAEENFPARIRLSSLEPMSISNRLIEVVSDSKTICPHLHLPMQSGDDEILARMKRPYRSRDFLALSQTLFEKIPGLALGLDLITGFPGEGEPQFQNTLDLLEQIPFAYLHIFPFSPRPGTPASRFRPKVPQRVSQERSRVLARLSRDRKEQYIKGQLGKNLEIVVEDRDGDWVFGRSENYLLLKVRSRAGIRERVRVRLLELTGRELIGEEI